MGLVVQLTGCICIEWNSNTGVSIGIITYYRESYYRWLANITECCDWLGLRSAKEWSRMSRREFIHVNVQRKIDWYHQLFSLGEGQNMDLNNPNPTTPQTQTVIPPFLYFFASFAILFTTQEYTHQSPGGASWMRAEILSTHYTVKCIVFHHSFRWVVFVLFKCLHGTAWGLQDRCMVQKCCLSTIPLFPG